VAVVGALLAAGGTAGAEEEHGKKKGEAHEGRLPVSYTERPLTLPQKILNIEGEFAVDHVAAATQGLTSLGLSLSARYGILDDLELYALVLPLEIGPFPRDPANSVAHYKNPKIGLTYRFLRDRFELAATLGVTIVTANSEEDPVAAPAPLVQTGAILEPGALFRFHITKEALLEGGLLLPIEFGSLATVAPGETLPGNNVGVGLRIPLAFAYDIREPFHVGLRTGVGMSSFANQVTGGSVAENLYIPLGIFAGYAIAGKDGPILDIDPFLTWNNLFTPSAQAHGLQSAESVHPADISVGVALGGFLYF
jgi:hypothetical protein